MKCEVAEPKIVFYAYGELEDESTPELERHLAECDGCRQELRGVQAMQNAMFLSPVLEPSPNLVARARVALDEAWTTCQRAASPTAFWAHGSAGWVRYARHLRCRRCWWASAFSAAALRRAIRMRARPVRSRRSFSPAHRAGAVSSVSGIVQTPDSDLVQVSYNRIVPETIQGTMDDPQIKQLLMLATQNHTDNDVRANSVSMLADKCRAGDCDASMGGADVRKALMVSLRYDKSPAVRMKALEGLQPYVSNDSNVRDAVLETLMNDASSNVRAAAINLLQPVQADSSVRQVMHTVSTQDQNPYIRNASRTYLQQVSEIQ